MNRTISIATYTALLIALIAAFSMCAYANSVGITYTQIVDDKSLGVTGDYQSQLTDRVTLEADANAQAGDIINARLQTNLIFDIRTIDLKLLVENKAKGYSIETLGREQSVGVALSVPIERLNFDIGIGGKNASPFSAPDAFSTLTDAGFAESAILGKGLEGLTPAPKGLPFKNGSALNAFVTTGFEAGIFDVDVRGIVEIAGEGDRQHQINMNWRTDGKVGDVLITTGIEIGLMSYQDAIHYETAVVTTAGFDF